MQALRIISADTHVVEPDGLWVERLDRKFRDRAVERVTRRQGKRIFTSLPMRILSPDAGGAAC